MTKEFTVAIACRRPKDTYVFIKQMESLQHCIEWCRGEIADRSQYDIDFIVVREGVAEAKDPIVWDSRKDVPPPKPLSQGEQYQRLVNLCEMVDGEVKLFKDGITKKWYVTANGKTFSGDCIDGALNQAAQEILGESE